MSGKLAALKRKCKNTRPRFDQRLYDRYRLRKEVGKGAFSVVYLAEDVQTSEYVAIKVVDKKLMQRHKLSVQSEIETLKKADHENIITLFDTLEDANYVYMILEFIGGGEMYDRIEQKGEFSEDEARSIMLQLLEAAHCMHSNGIVHRDLKPENILFCDKSEKSRIIVTDFGIAAMPGDSLMTQPSGTLGYAAPEVINRVPYTSKCDLWSLGVIAYILLVGYPPFNFEDNEELMECSRKGIYQFESPFWDHISDEAKHFVSSLMTVDPSQRLSAQQALNHPWILGRKLVPSNRAQTLRTKLRAAFLAARWVVRTQRCAASTRGERHEEESGVQIVGGQLANVHLSVTDSSLCKRPSGVSIPEKFREELVEMQKEGVVISFEDSQSSYLCHDSCSVVYVQA